LFERDGALLHVELWSSHLNVSVASPERAQAETIVKELRERFPLPDPSAFARGADHLLDVRPAWGAAGVSDDRRAGMERDLVELPDSRARPARGDDAGLSALPRRQLVLWHGQAGTGKTSAPRALAREWREWCQFHYIVDPDSFFGQHADYLISVLLQPAVPMMVGQGGFRTVAHFSVPDFDDPDEDEDAEKPWRLPPGRLRAAGSPTPAPGANLGDERERRREAPADPRPGRVDRLGACLVTRRAAGRLRVERRHGSDQHDQRDLARERRRLSPGAAHAQRPERRPSTWSPDGSWLLFESELPHPGTSHLWLMHPNGKGLHRATSWVGEQLYPSWAR
jgi:hypothetical protein